MVVQLAGQQGNDRVRISDFLFKRQAAKFDRENNFARIAIAEALSRTSS